MKVLMTGGAGFIGSNTAAAVLEAGHDVIVLDNYCNSDPGVIERIEQVGGRPIVGICCDVTDREAVRQVFREHKIDAVVHFAGLKAVGESVQQPVRYYRNNLDGILTMLEVMAEFGVKRFVFSSSATVYGGDNQVPFTEEMPLGECTNPYGWTKRMGEQILRDAAAADPELSVVLLRYFNPVGGHESGLLGEHPNGVPNNLMPYIVQVAQGKREKLSVFGDDYDTPDGTGVRDYIHVTDLAKGHVAALEYTLDHTGVEVVNLGTGHGVSVLELVQAFEKATGCTVPYEIAPRRAGDIAQCYAKVDKAEKVLNWRADKTVEEMCRDSWNGRNTRSEQ